MNPKALGWDIHRKFSMVSVREIAKDGELQLVGRIRLDHADRESMRRWLAGQPAGTPVAIEAAFGWPWIADLVEEFALKPHLAHPPSVRILAKNRPKSDRCDSDRLAAFQLMGILPESYLAPPKVREFRERIRYRMAIARIRGGVKNRIQAILHRQGILHPFSDLFGQAGRGFLNELPLSDASNTVLQGYLALLDKLTELLANVEGWMKEHLQKDETTTLLESLPGVGLILAHVLEAEIGEIERFPSYRHLASYAGLAPISDDSADRQGARHCSPACNHTLRWALIEAAATVGSRCASTAPGLYELYQRLSRHGRTKAQARTAVARELAKLVYVVWKKGKPYSTTPPSRPGSPVTTPRRDARSKSQKRRSVRSDQPRHPMVRPEPKSVEPTSVVGQTL